jgi:DNA-binding HxlR family transcriptional regulator
MTPKATKLLDHALTAHAARVGAKTDAERVTLGGEANAAYAALAAYIESLEQSPPSVSAELGRKILAQLDHGPARLVDLAVTIDHAESVVLRKLKDLSSQGRVVRIARGVWGLPGQSVQSLVESGAQTRRHGEMPDAVVAYLRARGCDVGTWEILAHLRGRVGDVSRDLLDSTLRRLKMKGEIDQIERGVWRARTAVNGYAPPSVTP